MNRKVRDNLRGLDSNYQSSQSESEMIDSEEGENRSHRGGIQMSKYYEIRP